MLRRAVRGAVSLLVVTLLAPPALPAQTASAPPPVALSALVDQTVALFPQLDGEVIDVQGTTVTVTVPRASGARPGLALEIFREGRELRHPRTGQVLGKAEQAVGRAVLTEILDRYSIATLDGASSEPPRAGDRVRTVAGKAKLTLVTLAGPGVRQNMTEAVTSELYEGLTRTGKFQVMLGDQIAVWLAQQNIGAEEFLKGRGVGQAAERFKADSVVAVYVQQVQRRPFMDVRVFAAARPDAALTTSFFVPSSIRPVQPGTFSSSERGQTTPERKPRSLLARLLGGDLEAGTYSSGQASIPLKEVARFPFVVVAMDVTVAPGDRVPRVVVTDGERIYVYKLVNRALEPEWTFYARSLGRLISVQLAELTGDGVLEVVANRYDTKIGMSSLIVGAAGGKPAALVDQVDGLLYAVDEKGGGVKQTLWRQRYREETFFDTGHADAVVVRDGALVKERAAMLPEPFRATGAAFANIMGKDVRSLVYIDAQSRLRIQTGVDEVWQSSSVVGGGAGPKIEVQRMIERGGRSFFYQMEPAPLPVDLDGDGIDEVVIPQNQLETGVLAVIFRGPAGIRLQQVNSGFEGSIVGVGALPPEDGGGPPILVSGVVRYRNFFKTSGETQVIMTTPE